MDLRVVKTKKNIRDAFLELRKKYSVDEIKVNMLCENAMINKTTFYNHYQDIYELSKELETEALNVFLGNFEDVDMLLENANRFINSMHVALEQSGDILNLLFRDKLDELTGRIEEHIRKYYKKEEQMLVSFLMGGSIHLMMNPANDNAEVENFLIEVITKIQR